jgi:hypothetical protein
VVGRTTVLAQRQHDLRIQLVEAIRGHRGRA